MEPLLLQSSDWLLRNVTYLQWDPPGVLRSDLRIHDGVIVECGTELHNEPEETVMDLTGTWVMPGLVCGHTHLYSSLSCGMPMPDSPPTSFANMLEKVWWRLDRALSHEAVAVSASVGAVAALRTGVTTIIDHHSSPNAIENSLLRIDDALEQVGVRRILCYEVSDRNGPEPVQAGVEAHERLLALPQGHSSEGMRATLIGAHANFTLSDDTLRRCAALAKEANVGLHIHVDEADDDAKITGESPVQRLDRLGALRPGSILAHCVHTASEDLARVADSGAWIAHQPRSNMNNGVGYAPVASFPERCFLGTDGIGSDILTELQFAWFQGQEGKLGWTPDRWMQMLARSSQYAGEQLGVSMGSLAEGAVADLVVLTPPPGPPLTQDNMAAALIFRFSPCMVRHVMVGGRWRLWNQKTTGISMPVLDEQARDVAENLWKRMREL